MKARPILSTSILALLCAAVAASASITLSTVTIGNPGNANTSSDGFHFYGGVNYIYSIGTYDVTLTQYTAFLNAVAATDSYSLYNSSMATNLNVAGILRSGSSGSYTYSVIGSGQRPVTYVSWFDAARFSNWLSNGQPIGAQGNGTTETGAYTLNGAISGVGVTNNGTGRYWIPSENEWYKAAYYDPSIAGVKKYLQWATKSNIAPGNIIGSTVNQANYNNGVYSVTQSGSRSSTQNYLTDVGAFSNSASAYGTYDQNGDVYQWNDSVNGSLRGVRGGSWLDVVAIPEAANTVLLDPAVENNLVGFRIATVPEPTVALSLICAGGFLLAWRKRPSAL